MLQILKTKQIAWVLDGKGYCAKKPLLLPSLETETPWLLCKVENNSGCWVMQFSAHPQSDLPICPMQNNVSEIPALNSLLPNCEFDVLSVQHTVEIVFIRNPVLPCASPVQMGGSCCAC